MFYCLVVGSRSFIDYELLVRTLDKLLINQKEVTIISGGAKGTDTLAEQYAVSKGYDCIVFNADWSRYGKSAGIIRNQQMHNYIAQYKNRGCVAFWDGQSKGTYSNFELARKYDNPLRIIRTDREKSVQKTVKREISR